MWYNNLSKNNLITYKFQDLNEIDFIIKEKVKEYHIKSFFYKIYINNFNYFKFNIYI